MAPFKKVMGSKPVVALVRAGATLFLAITLVAAGFAACLLPQSTEMLAERTVNTQLSPFSHDALVKGAIATRDYSFFGHDKHALLATMYEMNQDLVNSDYRYSASIPYPLIDKTADAQAKTTQELEAAFANASEVYALDASAISHLDDVYHVAILGYIALAIVFVLCIAAIAHVIFYRGWRGAWSIFAFAGGGLLILFAAIGVAALVDFNSFFALFHSFFFEADTWIFSIDSLLICMLPQNFWMGMGAIWLAVTAVLSLLSLFVGVKLRKKKARS